jgi:hypothetical protein
MTRRNWTHEELKAAADGDFEACQLDRRGFMKGSAAAAASGAFMMPISFRVRRRPRSAARSSRSPGRPTIRSSRPRSGPPKNNVKITNASMATQDDVQSKLVGGSAVRLDVTSYNQAYNQFYADELKI